MNRGVLFIFGFALFVALGGLVSAIPISSCGYTISSPGTYEITQDLSSSGFSECIIVSANNVIINGQGHRIDGTGTIPDSGYIRRGIFFPGHSYTEIELRNIEMYNYTGSIKFSNLSAVVTGLKLSTITCALPDPIVQSTCISLPRVYQGNFSRITSPLTPVGFFVNSSNSVYSDISLNSLTVTGSANNLNNITVNSMDLRSSNTRVSNLFISNRTSTFISTTEPLYVSGNGLYFVNVSIFSRSNTNSIKIISPLSNATFRNFYLQTPDYRAIQLFTSNNSIYNVSFENGFSNKYFDFNTFFGRVELVSFRNVSVLSSTFFTFSSVNSAQYTLNRITDTSITQGYTISGTIILEKRPFGQIESINPIASAPSFYSGTNLNSVYSISQNRAYINTSAPAPFRVPWRVTLHGITGVTTPQINRNGVECSAVDCQLESFAGGTAVFRVNDLGDYSIVQSDGGGGGGACPNPDSCGSDYDCNGTFGVPDIFAFLSDWFAQTC